MIESGGTVNLSHIWLTESPLVRVSEPYNSGPKLNQEYAIPTEVIPVKLRHVGSCFLVSYRRRKFAGERCAVSSLGGLAHAANFKLRHYRTRGQPVCALSPGDTPGPGCCFQRKEQNVTKL
jgi:hypothetical protein